jgi:MbtH protein
MYEEDDDQEDYIVVMNHEEQYSIWRVGTNIPAGWEDQGVRGPKRACLAHIEEVWTDMRPLSLRRAMAEADAAAAVAESTGAEVG